MGEVLGPVRSGCGNSSREHGTALHGDWGERTGYQVGGARKSDPRTTLTKATISREDPTVQAVLDLPENLGCVRQSKWSESIAVENEQCIGTVRETGGNPRSVVWEICTMKILSLEHSSTRSQKILAMP